MIAHMSFARVASIAGKPCSYGFCIVPIIGIGADL